MVLLILLVVTGGVVSLLACLLARRGRLSTGHGVTWLLLGALLLVAGLLVAVSGGEERQSQNVALLLYGLLVLLLAVSFNHSVALSRLEERVKLLSQEAALVNAAQPAPAASPADPPLAQTATEGKRKPHNVD